MMLLHNLDSDIVILTFFSYASSAVTNMCALELSGSDYEGPVNINENLSVLH